MSLAEIYHRNLLTHDISLELFSFYLTLLQWYRIVKSLVKLTVDKSVGQGVDALHDVGAGFGAELNILGSHDALLLTADRAAATIEN